MVQRYNSKEQNEKVLMILLAQYIISTAHLFNIKIVLVVSGPSGVNRRQKYIVSIVNNLRLMPSFKNSGTFY